MTRTLRLLALTALLLASRGSASTALFSTLQPDGSQTITALPLAADAAAAGPAVDLLRTTTLYLGTAYPRLSPDGSRVLFRGGDDTKTPYDRLLVVPAAGGAPVDITPGAPVAGLSSGASWFPDGARVVLVGAVADATGVARNAEIFAMPASGGAPKQLTFDADGGSKYFPATSPDGRSVAYVWERAGAYVLAVVPAAGGRVRVLDTNVPKDFAPSWSRDSRYLAYPRWNGQRTYTDLYRVDATTGARRNLTLGRFQGQPATTWQGTVASPTFSPDGARIAFAYVSGARPSERGDVYAIPAGGGTATRLNDAATPVGMYDVVAGLAWTPDGMRVVFPYVDSDDPASVVWSWDEGLAAANLAGAISKPLYGPLSPGYVADVTVR